ncbi:hypothetical protein LINPERHAP1_LOCUS4125, partial [Linum perenne]
AHEVSFYRGLIRDDQGRFVLAFATRLGSCSVVRAEMRVSLMVWLWLGMKGFESLESKPTHRWQ